jgi:hypothetical protein
MEKQNLAQMMEQMLAKMDASHKEAEALRNDMKINQEKMDANQAKADADRKLYQDMMAKIDAKMNTTLEEMNASQKEMLAKMEAERKADVENLKSIMERMMDTDQTDVKFKELTETVETTHRECEEPSSAEMKVCHEATETDIEKIEPDSGMMQSVAEHQEVPREDASVMPVRGLRKQRRGRKQAAGRREEPKKLNRGICRSWEKLAAACRKVSRRATVAWRKRNILRKFWTQRNCGLRKEVTAAGIKITRCAGHRRKGQNKDDVERETRKGRTEENRRLKGPQCKTGIKGPTMNNIEGWNPRERAPLGSGGSRKKDICDIFREKYMEHGVGISSG